MFLIIPKSRQQNRTLRATSPSRQDASETEATSKQIQGPTRVQNACDECRMRKIKCDGHHPCARCRARNVVCVFGYADARKRSKGPLTAAQTHTLEAQNSRLMGAIKSMASKIDSLEEIIQAKKGTGRVATHVEGPDAQAAPFDLNAVLEKYAPSHESSTTDASTDMDQHEPRSKKARLDRATVLNTSSTPAGSCNLLQEPMANDLTSSSDVAEILHNSEGTRFGFGDPQQTYPQLCGASIAHASPREAETMTGKVQTPSAIADEFRDTISQPSIEDLFLQCQNMDMLMESIDWDESRFLYANS